MVRIRIRGFISGYLKLRTLQITSAATTPPATPTGIICFDVVLRVIRCADSNRPIPKSIALLQPCQITSYALKSQTYAPKLAFLILFLTSYHNVNNVIEFSTSDYPRNHLLAINFM